MPVKPTVLVVAIGLCLSSSAARAQGGLAATLGVGTGSGTITCGACTHAGNMGGSTATLQVVQKVSPYLRVGWTADGWWHSRDEWGRGIGALNAVVFYYPRTVRRSGVFIGGGPSYSWMVATVTDSTGLQRHGWGLAGELGYDMGPHSSLSLTPFFQYSYAWVGDIYYPKGSGIPFARGWKHQVVSLGVGVTWHERLKSDQ